MNQAGTQLALELFNPVRVPREHTQNYRLLIALQSGVRLTVAKALSEHQIYALSQRIGELKRLGWPIKSRTVETAGGAHVSEYFL